MDAHGPSDARRSASVRILQGKLIRPPNYRRAEIARFDRPRWFLRFRNCRGKSRGCVVSPHRISSVKWNRETDLLRRFCSCNWFLFFFYMDFVDKVENYSSNEARNCSNLLSSYVYTREENSLDIRRWWILEINETLTRFGKIVF